MFVGITLPEIIAHTSTYSLFASIILVVCFVVAMIVIRNTIINTAEYENETSTLSDKMIEYTITDTLTGTLNRRAMDHYIEKLLQDKQAKQIGVVFFDVDYFKKYNDYYGHISGDGVLRDVAKAAESRLMDMDNAYLFRYGGEEFIALIEGADERSLIDAMEGVRSAIFNANIVRADIEDFDRITVTVGGSIEPMPNYSGDYVMAADNQLYIGKTSKRNSIYFADKCVDPSGVNELEAITANAKSNIALFGILNAICGEIKNIFAVDKLTETVTIYRMEGKTASMNAELVAGNGYYVLLNRYIEKNVHPADRENFKQQMQFGRICEKLQSTQQVNVYYRVLRDGAIGYYKAMAIRLGSPDDFMTVAIAIVTESVNISERQMMHAIETDELTGVYTRQAFSHHTREYLEANPDKHYSVAIIEVQNFNLVNTTYGGAEGDKVLRYISKVLFDMPEIAVTGRYGADQFVILAEVGSFDSDESISNRIEAITKGAPLPYLTFKVGINRDINRDDTMLVICDKAMLALKSVKPIFEKYVALYDGKVISDHYKVQMYESMFERAITCGEFVVWCQPKHDTFTSEINGAEALVRWQTAEGFISPGEFVPIFENDGLISRLDEYVFEYICREQRRLIDAGCKVVPVSINMSRSTLLQNGSIDRYNAITEKYHISKELIPLELTESASTDNIKMRHLVLDLKNAGFVLFMDDFGSGYSSLANLSMLPFDAVKLDKSLIDDIDKDNGKEILRHITELAHFLKMEVVAEGVENGEQHDFLKRLRCDTIQGYYFNKPMPFANYVELIKNGKNG